MASSEEKNSGLPPGFRGRLKMYSMLIGSVRESLRCLRATLPSHELRGLLLVGMPQVMAFKVPRFACVQPHRLFHPQYAPVC